MWFWDSNSFWIDDVTPCVTYGLRGVVHSSIEISSERPDVHSGVEGGAIVEPMVDMWVYAQFFMIQLN
jgi:di- and tripeptidase